MRDTNLIEKSEVISAAHTFEEVTIMLKIFFE
jgi:hypothetical protein